MSSSTSIALSPSGVWNVTVKACTVMFFFWRTTRALGAKARATEGLRMEALNIILSGFAGSLQVSGRQQDWMTPNRGCVA